MATVTKTIKPGGTPGTDCDYTSISAALAANCGLASKDLVALTTNVVLNCVAGSGADTSSVNTNGWTCNSAYNLTIRGYDTGKHAGKYDAAKYVIRPASGNVVSLDAAYDVVEDLILDLQNTTSYGCGVKIGATSNLTHYVRRCIIRKSGTGTNQRGVDAATAGNIVLLEHCVVYGQSGKAFTYGALVGQNSCTLRVYNTTLYNCATGLWAYSGYAYFYNCLAASCTTCFSGNAGTNCASTDATAATYKSVSPAFTDAANEDFHLASNPWSGTDITTLSPAGVALDIDGQAVTTWLVGADSVPGVPSSGFMLTVDSAWAIKAESGATLSWAIFSRVNAASSWAVKALREASASWAVRALAQVVSAWAVKNKAVNNSSWAVKARVDKASSWAVKRLDVLESSWSVFGAGVLTVVTSWAIKGKTSVDVSWANLAAKHVVSAWAVKTSQEVASEWRVVNVSDVEAAWAICGALSVDSSWAIMTVDQVQSWWRIGDFEEIPTPLERVIRILAEGRAVSVASEGRMIAVNKESRTIIVL